MFPTKDAELSEKREKMIKSESESRRVKMTKRLLKDALMELLENKPLAAVSVTELCKAADVNRSTFYSYYSGIRDLLEETENDILRQLPETAGRDGPVVGLTERMIEDFTVFFSYVRHHARDFSILLEIGDIHFSDALMEEVMQRFPGPAEKRKTPLMSRWGYIYATSGVIGLMRDWISRGFPVGDREFAATVLEMSFRANSFEV